MLGSNVLDLVPLKSGTSEDLIAHKGVKDLYEFNKSETCFCGKTFKRTGKRHVLLHYSLEVKSWGDHFVATICWSISTTTCRYQIITWLGNCVCLNSLSLFRCWILSQRIDAICQLLILYWHLDVNPSLLINKIWQLELLLLVEIAQVFALLLL